MIDMRLKKQASAIPTSVTELSNKLSDSTWECTRAIKEIMDEINMIDEETYDSNYDKLEGLKSKLQEFENQLSDMSEFLQNVK